MSFSNQFSVLSIIEKLNSHLSAANWIYSSHHVEIFCAKVLFGKYHFEKIEKAEQKEKEKRHRERIRSVEIERERIQRAARFIISRNPYFNYSQFWTIIIPNTFEFKRPHFRMILTSNNHNFQWVYIFLNDYLEWKYFGCSWFRIIAFSSYHNFKWSSLQLINILNDFNCEYHMSQ